MTTTVAAPPRRRLTVLTLVWAAGLLLSLAVLVLPLPRARPFWLLYLGVSSFSLWLIVPVAAGGLLVLRERSSLPLWLRRMCAVSVAAGLLAAGLPAAISWSTAAATGTSLSAVDYFTGGINFAAAPDPARTVTYATVDGQALPLDVWRPPPADHPIPAVVWLHGGGFVSGQQSRYPKWDESLSGQGYAVFDVGYRLAPPVRWDEATGDVKCALGWVVTHAAQLGVDPSRIVVAGESAGGNLALQAAYTVGDPQLPPSCPAPDVPVRAVAAFYPLTDLTAGWQQDFDGALRASMPDYLGGTPETRPEEYRVASPVDHVRPGLPPTLLVQGTHDSIAGGQAARLDGALATAGVAHRLVELPGAEHGFDVQWGAWATQIARHVLTGFLAQNLSGTP